MEIVCARGMSLFDQEKTFESENPPYTHSERMSPFFQ